MLIDGFAISGYRSFGSELQRIGPLSKINLIIGQNNSGKSNLLLFLTQHYEILVNLIASRKTKLKFKELDRHRGAINDSAQFGLAIDVQHKNYEKLWNYLLKEHNISSPENIKSLLKRLLNANAFTDGNKISWFIYEANSLKQEYYLDSSLKKKLISEGVLSEGEWSILCQGITKSHGGIDYNIDRVLSNIGPFYAPPQIKLIPTFRAIRKLSSDAIQEYDFSGLGIIDELLKIQIPTYDKQVDKDRFGKINDFMRTVIENESATLEVPHNKETINVSINGNVLPIESLGTGIHQVIMIAAASTILENSVICMEEPELHLHPALQRKLLRYLNENTNNQYIITTHSAHFLDTSIASVFHVKYANGQSIVTPIIKNHEKFMVCEDLGYRASDIIQSNCIIWVEGPSDRIYLNHWIHAQDNTLIEGVHYSIMFYGGKLLSHLSADHEDIESFISLRQINRKMSIIMDSDKNNSRAHINNTKKRLKDEFNFGPGFAWITKGREIENYVDADLIETVVCDIHKDVDGLISKEMYSNLLKYKKRGSSISYDADKIKVAHKVTEQPANIKILDLQSNIRELVGFIKASNK